MASIIFTDAVGTATLTNGKPGRAAQFANWCPTTRPVGDAIERDADGARIMFQVRDDFGATFELRRIPSATIGGVSMADVADRLRAHLLRGGTCAVQTEDDASHTYATCGLAPSAEPQLTMSDARTIEFTLSLALIDLSVTPTQMVCHYRSGT
jgi:hypothetical protein